MAWMAIVAVALSAAQQMKQGRQEEKFNNFQAAQATADANAEREQGQVEANKIRKAGKYTRAEATSALAAGGVEVGAGTALKIDQQIVRNVEEDALQQILFGDRKGERLDQEAAGLRAAGKNAKQRANVGAVTSLLSSGSKLSGSGWKSVAAEQPPAPVEDRTIRINR